MLEGLLVSGMHETATGVVENLLQLLAAHGFVPNGYRLYYLNRSQPPLPQQLRLRLRRDGCRSRVSPQNWQASTKTRLYLETAQALTCCSRRTW